MATSKAAFIEIPRLCKAGASYIEAEPHTHRDLHSRIGVDLPREQIDGLGFLPCVPGFDPHRISRYRRGVAKGSDSASIFGRVSRSLETLEPGAKDLRVRVQENHITVGVQTHAAIHRARE